MMRKMKRIIAIVLLVVIACTLVGCKKKTANDLWDSIVEGNDPESVRKIREAIRGDEDTYCERCDKYIEGKVRICTYCGQYI